MPDQRDEQDRDPEVQDHQRRTELPAVAEAVAADASAGVARGHWLYTFVAVTALGVLGFATGPTLAILLLLSSGLSVIAVNIVSSLAFAALTPFVAIAYALLYFDLAATGSESPPTE